jgi:hypothetical protein
MVRFQNWRYYLHLQRTGPSSSDITLVIFTVTIMMIIFTVMIVEYNYKYYYDNGW